MAANCWYNIGFCISGGRKTSESGLDEFLVKRYVCSAGSIDGVDWKQADGKFEEKDEMVISVL